ncbi:MAG: glutamate--tRNA ligase, partial [Rhodospirillaceae bacterium]|nr:glutamate--tRNA ligase [Rhodospirillaceae bacterium]
DAARKEGRTRLYDGRWRDRDPSQAPAGVDPVIRIRMPLESETTINDLVQGEVTVANDRLDDMVLLRADGSPTYMLSVVVDDHDMGVTHAIRGDDHLNNAFRQLQLFLAMDWPVPEFAHIPLIHGPDGAKLSKRHGALGVDAYRDMGFLPEAIRNYLMRLGWSHGDDEIISTEQAVEWFDLADVGRSASRFDLTKLENLNGHYIREAEDGRLAELVAPRLTDDGPLGQVDLERLQRGMHGLKQRAKTLLELSDNSQFYIASSPLTMTDKAAGLLDADARLLMAELATVFETVDDWSEASVESAVRDLAEAKELKLGKLAQPLRAAVTGSTSSPGIFEVLDVLGRRETLDRINAICGGAQ